MPPTTDPNLPRPLDASTLGRSMPEVPDPFVEAMARRLLRIYARFEPESFAWLGMDGFDEEVRRILPEHDARRADAFAEIRREVRVVLEESQGKTRDELEILLQVADAEHRCSRTRAHLVIPRLDLGRDIYHGVSGLLDPQIGLERHPAVVVRLRRYAGLMDEDPIVEQAIHFLRDRLRRSGLLSPYRAAVEREIADLMRFIDASQDLLQRYDISGWKQPWYALRSQLIEYGAFLRVEMIPRARVDFRLPDELYETYLQKLGIDLEIGELTRRARAAVVEMQFDKEALAQQLAAKHGWRETHCEAVFERLRENLLGGRRLLERYEECSEEMRRILDREDLMTLPESSLPIRLATAPESLLLSAPRLRIPRLLGNEGELPELILPDLKPVAEEIDGGIDFAHEASIRASLAREAFPGLGLYFSTLLEGKMGIGRSLVGFNAALAHGWALYAESLVRRHFPLATQLVSLQRRQLATLRAFLDPGLHRGMLLPDEAEQVLLEAGLTKARARREIELYTFQEPGQAAAAFAGDMRLRELRGEVRARLGPAFDEKEFHDTVLSRGCVPLDLLRREVLLELGVSEARV